MEVTIKSIRNLLETNDKAVLRALVVLHDRQTSDEQAVRDTKYRNCRGFSAADARRLSYYADLIKKGETLYPGTVKKARARLMKYAGQLVEIANEKANKGN